MSPYDRDRDNDEQIQSFKQEHIPQTKMGLVRNGICKKRDVSLRCIRRCPNDVLYVLKAGVGLWHHLLGDTFLNVCILTRADQGFPG
jgi:hypothetical protein